MILLHIGTNDGPVAGSTEIDTASILDEIDLWESGSNGNPVTVILAKIVDQNPQNPDLTHTIIATSSLRIGPSPISTMRNLLLCSSVSTAEQEKDILNSSEDNRHSH